jgi:hypothetical protein
LPGPRLLLDLVSGLALVPLSTPEFLAAIPQEALQGLVPRWLALWAKGPNDRGRADIDLILEAVYRRQGQEKEAEEVACRLRQRPRQPREGCP